MLVASRERANWEKVMPVSVYYPYYDVTTTLNTPKYLIALMADSNTLKTKLECVSVESQQ